MATQRGKSGPKGDSSVTEEPAHVLYRSAQLTCGLGAAFTLFFLAGLLSFSQAPRKDASDAEIVSYYSGGNQELVLLGGLYLLPFAAVAFLWFIAALREWVTHSARTIDHLISTVQMLSGIGFITLLFAAAGAATIVSLSSRLAGGEIDATLARQFPLYGQTLLIVFGMRMAAIFVTSTAKIGHGARLYPHWFVLASYAVAVALFLAATLNVWLAAVFPLWVAVLCAIIWRRSREGATAIAPRAASDS